MNDSSKRFGIFLICIGAFLLTTGCSERVKVTSIPVEEDNVSLEATGLSPEESEDFAASGHSHLAPDKFPEKVRTAVDGSRQFPRSVQEPATESQDHAEKSNSLETRTFKDREVGAAIVIGCVVSDMSRFTIYFQSNSPQNDLIVEFYGENVPTGAGFMLSPREFKSYIASSGTFVRVVDDERDIVDYAPLDCDDQKGFVSLMSSQKHP